jgi:EpsI family protein
MLIWPITESRLSTPYGASKIEIAEISSRSGWSPVEKPSADWTPELNNPSQVRIQTFEKGGQRVSVFVGIFANESWSSKLVSASNQLAGGGKSNWSLAERGVALTEIAGRPIDAQTGIVVGGQVRIVAWHWYWIDGVSTGNGLRAKFEQLLIRLKGMRTTSAWVTIYTVAGTASESRSTLLQEFVRDMGGALETALVRTVKK